MNHGSRVTAERVHITEIWVMVWMMDSSLRAADLYSGRRSPVMILRRHLHHHRLLRMTVPWWWSHRTVLRWRHGLSRFHHLRIPLDRRRSRVSGSGSWHRIRRARWMRPGHGFTGVSMIHYGRRMVLVRMLVCHWSWVTVRMNLAGRSGRSLSPIRTHRWSQIVGIVRRR